jgi:phenylacetate-CoA ligase
MPSVYDQDMHDNGRTSTTYNQRRQMESWDAEQLSGYQLQRLNELLARILPHNKFYNRKLGSIRLPLDSWEDFGHFAYTYKEELIGGEQVGGFANNLSYPVEQYSRLHRTSGTRGRPLIVLDTAEDWQWWIDTWQFVLDAAEVQPADRAVLAFSFGPFVGFWSAFDAVAARGALVVPAGGMKTVARLELLRATTANVLFCTPSYALHMAEVGLENQIEVGDLQVRRIIVAGEPGGSVPAIRDRIEAAWNARVVDHAGASEVGPWGYADAAGKGIYVNESQFVAEFISVETGRAADEGELSELVLTTLGRRGSPVIRYRTGDLVRPTWNDAQPCRFVLLIGGVLGRTDDMMIIRGVNVFPSSVEQILRSFPEIIEYRMTVTKQSAMDELLIEIEDRLEKPERVAKEMLVKLGLRVKVRCLPINSLPRFEGKGKRFVDKR